MDASSHDKQFPPSQECAVHNSENASFILGTGKLVMPDPCTPDTFKSPLDFNTVTVEQLGITPESFVKPPSGKSPSYLKKARRRSTVGARGSPETNHLIRFIAQQRRLKNAERSPLAYNSPLEVSPGLDRSANSLRVRISAFQSAFHSIQETETLTGSPAVETSGLDKKKINLHGVKAVFQSTVVSINGAISPKSLKLGSAESGHVVAESVLLPELMEASHGLGVADCVDGTRSINAVPLDTPTAQGNSDIVPDIRLPAKPLCRSNSPSSETFVLRSVLKKPDKPFAEGLQEHSNNLCDGGTHPNLIPDPSFCCREQKADQENSKTPVFLNVRKRKKVTFGEDLSPEVFDQSLPANTPLRKGGTPVPQKDLSDTSPLLPEHSPVAEQLLQPNFDDNGENLENIEPLEVSFAVLSPNKSSIAETLSGTESFSSSNNHEKITCKSRPTRTSNRRKFQPDNSTENVCSSHNTEAEPWKEKKIKRRKSQDSKCTSRALPKKKLVRTKKKKIDFIYTYIFGERESVKK
uniref:Cell division cycle associated 2 n=1 Tax=Nannospalax galili TaxID=1026970 RepID=A0A8C6R641_NANGA